MFECPRTLWFMYMWQELPEWGRRNVDEFRALNPGWDVRVLEALPAEFPEEGRRALELAPTPRFRADIVRYWLLWQQGGIYVDLDCRPLRPFDELLALAPVGTRAFFPMHLGLDWVSDNFCIGGLAGEGFWLDSYTVCLDRKQWRHKPRGYFGAMNAYPRAYATETVWRLPADWCVDAQDPEHYAELFDRERPIAGRRGGEFLKHYRVCGRQSLEAMRDPQRDPLAWEEPGRRVAQAREGFRADFARGVKVRGNDEGR